MFPEVGRRCQVKVYIDVIEGLVYKSGCVINQNYKVYFRWYLGVAVMHVPCFAKICGLRFDHKAEESLAAASQLVIVLVCPNSIFIFYLLRFLFTRA
ncbi:unnamed protein product [Arabidopsis halleri]